MIDTGAEVEEASGDGTTSIFNACEGDHMSVVQLLIDVRADVQNPETMSWPKSFDCADWSVVAEKWCTIQYVWKAVEAGQYVGGCDGYLKYILSITFCSNCIPQMDVFIGA